MFGIADNQEFLNAIGIADVPQEQKDVLVAGLEDLAQKRLTIKISNHITDEQADEFEAITDEKAAYKWILKNIPEFPMMVEEVLEDMKNDILAHKMKVVG